MEWILNLVGQGHPHAACLALAVKLFFILRGGYKKKGGGKGGGVPVLLKLSAPMRSAPENVVTATPGRVKDRRESGQ